MKHLSTSAALAFTALTTQGCDNAPAASPQFIERESPVTERKLEAVEAFSFCTKDKQPLSMRANLHLSYQGDGSLSSNMEAQTQLQKAGSALTRNLSVFFSGVTAQDITSAKILTTPAFRENDLRISERIQNNLHKNNGFKEASVVYTLSSRIEPLPYSTCD